MKLIPLTKQKFAIVDDEDYEYLNQFKWQLSTKGYACRTKRIGLRKFNKKITFWMHREVLKTPDNFQTDHINGNKLDNRRENLRTANNSQNHGNISLLKSNTSGYKGVSFDKSRKLWEAYISINDKKKHLGRFSTPESAALAYNKAAREYFDEFASLNTI